MIIACFNSLSLKAAYTCRPILMFVNLNQGCVQQSSNDTIENSSAGCLQDL